MDKNDEKVRELQILENQRVLLTLFRDVLGSEKGELDSENEHFIKEDLKIAIKNTQILLKKG